MNTAKYLGKRLREDTIGKATGLATGKLNAWNLPEFTVARDQMETERDLGMGNYLTNLTRSGVEGPAAALGLERFNQGYGNELLDLLNNLRGLYLDKGLTLGKQATEEDYRANRDRMQDAFTWQGQHDQRRAQPNDFMKTIGGIKAATGVVSDLANLGFGGAAMLGKLPGMNGVSSLASSGQSSIIEQMIQMLMSKLGTGGLGG